MKNLLKYGLIPGLLALGLTVPVQAAQEQTSKTPNVCLRIQDIDHSVSNDGKTIVYYMRDGKVWRNTLFAACSDLKTEGYTQVVNGGEICANQQLIQTLRTGRTCRLGEFALEKSKVSLRN